jgi:long-subunit fatty acid transport protein
MRLPLFRWSLALATGVLWPLHIAAQTNAEVTAGVEFNFSNPGARSLGFAGAFVALADDATAAQTNPAGLMILGRPEVSFEARGWTFTHSFTDRGRASGSVTGIGIDTIPGLQSGRASDTTVGPSFLSFVYPGGRWAVAGYRHELANFKARFSTEGPVLYTSEPDGRVIDQRVTRALPTRNRLDLDIVSYGVSAAAELGRGVSVGLTALIARLKLDALTERFGSAGAAQFDFGTAPGGIFGPPAYVPEHLRNQQTQTADTTDVAFTVGGIWRASDELSAGVVFRQGPDFPVTATHRELRVPIAGCPPAEGDAARCVVTPVFHVPDVLALGVVLRPYPNATLSVEYDHVAYSQLVSDFATFPLEIPRARPEDFAVDDGNEVHVGFEYVLQQLGRPVALRIGFWRDPDHRIRFSDDSFGATSTRALFMRGRTATHLTAGVGLVFRNAFQVDAAFDGSDRIRTGSISIVARF